MTKSSNAIQFDAPYLRCMNCGDECDPCDRYSLQVDHIIRYDHRSHRVVFDVCAACYRDLFPWRLDWIDEAQPVRS
jgi:hypothetical protein